MPSDPNVSSEDEALDDLIRRVLEAGDPMRGKELLPFTMTTAEMRAEAERRTQARPDKRSRGGKGRSPAKG